MCKISLDEWQSAASDLNTVYSDLSRPILKVNTVINMLSEYCLFTEDCRCRPVLYCMISAVSMDTTAETTESVSSASCPVRLGEHTGPSK